MREVRGEETGMPDGQEAQVRTPDVEVLRESGVHKLLIADHDGNWLATCWPGTASTMTHRPTHTYVSSTPMVASS